MTKTIIWSVLYWFAALTLIGLVDVIHGDCAVSKNIPQCNLEARRIDLTLLAAAAVFYGYWLWKRRAARPPL
jgi:hypothetical protein